MNDWIPVGPFSCADQFYDMDEIFDLMILNAAEPILSRLPRIEGDWPGKWESDWRDN